MTFVIVSDSEFQRLLADFRLEDLHQSDQTIFALRHDLTLAYFNSGWSKFAVENGEPQICAKWPVGRCILDGMTATLRPFFNMNFAMCLSEQRPWGHRYECSSPQELREFKMLVYPLGNSQGFLVINSLVVTASQNDLPSMQDRYRNGHGLITQCCHCKRFQHSHSDSNWEWVPDWAINCPTNTSHGVCQVCFGFYYGSISRTRHRFPRMFHTHEALSTRPS